MGCRVILPPTVAAQEENCAPANFYARPEEQSWVAYRSEAYPYTINYPLGWIVFPDGGDLDTLLNTMTKGDVFGGGIPGKAPMKMIVSSEVASPHVGLDDYLRSLQINIDSRKDLLGLLRVDIPRDMTFLNNTTKAFSIGVLGIERFYIPILLNGRAWRIQMEFQQNVLLLTNDERINIYGTLQTMLNSFTPTA